MTTRTITNHPDSEPERRAAAPALPPGLVIPDPSERYTPVRYAEALGEAYLAITERCTRRNRGHYLTPGKVAGFMGRQAFSPKTTLRVLDPGSGTGILACGFCEAAAASGFDGSIHLDVFETDDVLSQLSELALRFCQEWLRSRAIQMTYTVRQEDFVLTYAHLLAGEREANDSTETYDAVIANPPYFKIPKDDERAKAAASVVHGQPNIYALFMVISAELLSELGRLAYIVPRSFASGYYFRLLRDVLFQRVRPTAIHLFESRKNVFRNQTVLQENLILVAERVGETPEDRGPAPVVISHSQGVKDLDSGSRLTVPLNAILDLQSDQKELRIPTSLEDLDLVKAIQSWPNTLASLGLNISTGPVVPFRAKRFLLQHPDHETAAPLLWMHHVRPMKIEWPRQGIDKPQWLKNESASTKLLVLDRTYVLLRRFTAKEEKRRLVAAPLVRANLGADRIGLENHLNYIHGVSRELDEDLAYGIAALLNSTLLDQYFRLSSGNTQASATEIREIPFPGEAEIRAIGEMARGMDTVADNSALDEIMVEVLKELSCQSHIGATIQR